MATYSNPFDVESATQIGSLGIVFNFCYTFGWLVEAVARTLSPGLTPKFGPRLLLAGMIFSLCVISLPAVFWVGYLIVHAV